MARHHKKIKFRLLRIAEKEILADVDPEDLVNTVAGIDRECGFVVDAGVGDIQGVEKIVSAYLGIGFLKEESNIPISSSSFLSAIYRS